MALEKTANLDFREDTVIRILTKEGRVLGVETSMGLKIFASAVILTNGTFLNGIIYIGEKSFGGGRISDKPSVGLTENLNSMGFESARLKTGTPVRIDGRSIDYSRLEEQTIASGKNLWKVRRVQSGIDAQPALRADGQSRILERPGWLDSVRLNKNIKC